MSTFQFKVHSASDRESDKLMNNPWHKG